MKYGKLILLAFALYAPFPAAAVTIDISYPAQDIVRAVLYDIDDVDDRVYTIRVAEDGKAEVRFGDGIAGARPESGGSVVASYRYGSGSDGKIVNEYEIGGNELPFIPIADFLPDSDNQPGASFILAGLISIEFDFSSDGLRVIDARLLPSAVPIPASAWLFAAALVGLAGLIRRGRQSL